MSAFLGIWAIGQRVVQEAQTRVRYDLSSAWAVYQSQMEAMKTVARLMAVRGPLVEACTAQKWQDRRAWQDVQGILGWARLGFHLDFVSVVSPDGQVVARASPPYRTGDYRTADPIVAKALAGTASCGTVLISPEELGARPTVWRTGPSCRCRRRRGPAPPPARARIGAWLWWRLRRSRRTAG